MMMMMMMMMMIIIEGSESQQMNFLNPVTPFLRNKINDNCVNIYPAIGSLVLLYLSCVRYANTQEIQHSIICSTRERPFI